MLKDVIIRPIRESDAPSIYAVTLEAWQYTYHTIFDQQFIENFVTQDYAPEATISLFPRLQSGIMYFYIAEYEAEVIGFCNIGLGLIRKPQNFLEFTSFLPISDKSLVENY